MSSYDVGKYLEHLDQDDPLQIIIRGHLYIEFELISIITKVLPNPEVINFNKLPFPQKLNLAVALGILSKRDAKPYHLLNKIRNNITHNLDFQFNDDTFEELREMMYSRYFREWGDGTIVINGESGEIVDIKTICITLRGKLKARSAFVRRLKGPYED